MTVPQFSIVIPMYDRQREIRRAIESCLAQDFTNFELIVVDDASGDDSVKVVSSYRDPRIKLVRHARNRGQCPARNTGIAASLAEWVVFLDSDHALKPGSLSVIRRHVERDGKDVDRLGFMFEWDTGVFSPEPAPDGSVLDYQGWLRFGDKARLSDTLLCTRRSTFTSLPWTDSSAAETEYHLNFARQFKTRLIPETLAIQYTDAANRLTAPRPQPDPARTLRRACDDIESGQRMLHAHGDALRLHAPGLHERIYRRFVVSSFLAGRPLAGLGRACGYFRYCRTNPAGAIAVAVAAISPKTYPMIHHFYSRRLARNWELPHVPPGTAHG